jgi:hypothetical protein
MTDSYSPCGPECIALLPITDDAVEVHADCPDPAERAYRIRGTRIVRDLLVADFEVIAASVEQAREIIGRQRVSEGIHWRYAERVDDGEATFSVDGVEDETAGSRYVEHHDSDCKPGCQADDCMRYEMNPPKEIVR